MEHVRIIERLRRGDVLHMQLSGGKRLYWFEAPYQPVSESAFLWAEHELQLVEAGDCLFGTRFNSQSIMAAQGGVQ